jgi:hypothetical protein
VGETRAGAASVPPESPWAQVGGEPSIADLLSDPTILDLLRADCVMVGDILALIDKLVQPNVDTFGEFR